MAMTFKCPVCGRELEAPEGAAGQRGVCKFCGARIVAPSAPGKPARVDTPAEPAVPVTPPPAAPEAGWRPAASLGRPDAGTWNPAAAANPILDLPVADLMQRAFGFAVDFVGQWVVFLLLRPLLSLVNPWPTGNLGDLLTSLTSGAGDPRALAGGLDLISLLLAQFYWLFWIGLIQWLYFALFESSTLQATPGKLLAGTKVTDMDGKRIGFGRATTRAFAKGLSAALCYVGYLVAAFNDRRQTLHDMIAQTLVLKR